MMASWSDTKQLVKEKIPTSPFLRAIAPLRLDPDSADVLLAPNIFVRDEAQRILTEMGLEFRVLDEAQRRRPHHPSPATEPSSSPVNAPTVTSPSLLKPDRAFTIPEYAKATVEASCNALAVQSVMAMATSADPTFQLVVVTGASGSGKTTLAKMLMATIETQRKVAYIRYAEFMERWVGHIQAGRTGPAGNKGDDPFEQFRSSLTGSDLLVVDDLWGIQRGETVRLALRQIIVGLLDRGAKVLVLTHAPLIECLSGDSAFLSILSGGLQVTMQPVQTTHRKLSPGQVLDSISKLSRRTVADLLSGSRRYSRERSVAAIALVELCGRSTREAAEELHSSQSWVVSALKRKSDLQPLIDDLVRSFNN